jgi:hypothetical protein
VSSPRSAKPRSRKSRGKNRWTALRRRVVQWLQAHKSWQPWQRLATVPRPLRIAGLIAGLLAAFALVNLVYHVVRKPTELFVVAGHRFDKEPIETWREYGPLFRTYATKSITPELLAALAQVESTGNPVARTYWRWRLALNPFSLYQPASSAVGLFQMTDPAFAEAARYCIRDNAVVEDDCGASGLYIRAVPSHAIELTSIYLDRQVAGVLARTPSAKPNARETQDLAAFIHLCGAGPGSAFARRGFKMTEGERCGDHLVAAYVGKVNAMKREFLRLTGNASK